MDEKRAVETPAPAFAALLREGHHPPACAQAALPGAIPGGVSRPGVPGIPEAPPGRSSRKSLRPPGPSPALPLAGEVRAGFPSPAEEELRDLVSFDEYLVPRPESSFLVQARDNSMIGEGIREGDLVIIERGREPKHGDVVLAEVDGVWTMKYFSREKGRVVLRAADPGHSPVVPRSELRLGGVVTAVVRKYHR